MFEGRDAQSDSVIQGSVISDKQRSRVGQLSGLKRLEGYRLIGDDESLIRDGWALAQTDSAALRLVYEAYCRQARGGSVHAYMVALEFWRREKFYIPRAGVLRPLCNDLEDLLHNRISGLSISLPPRAGKSETEKRFIAMCMGLHPNLSTFFVSHTDAMARKFHSEIIDIIESKSYGYKDIFPNISIVDKSVEDKYIDVSDNGERNAYKSFYARGIEGNMSGVLEASFLLCCDDLIRNSEEARNPERVKTAVVKYLEDIRQRRTSGEVRELHIGTRWAVSDVIGVLEQEYGNDPRWRFRRIGALRIDPETGEEESNFSYMSAGHFQEQRRIMNIADGNDISFNMIFQQEPADREGLLFPKDSLSFYDSLPGSEAKGGEPENDNPSGIQPFAVGDVIAPDRVIMAIDCAFGGADYFSAPIGYIYDNDVYIDDVIYVNKEQGTKDRTLPLVINKIIEHNVTAVHIEANNGGDFFADSVRAELRERGLRVAVTDARAPSNKSKGDRIIAAIPEIKGTDPNGYHMRFRRGGYGVFMRHLCAYNSDSKYAGKQPDDAPDSLAGMAAHMLNGKNRAGRVVVSGYSRKGLGL